MSDISRVSQITAEDVWSFLNPAEDMYADAENTIKMMIRVAIAFIKNYTGREDLDAYQDFVICVLVLCQDMWDNRTMYVDNENLNYVVRSILNMHSINLL